MKIKEEEEEEEEAGTWCFHYPKLKGDYGQKEGKPLHINIHTATYKYTCLLT